MKIRCEYCGASIDTDKETKCSKCGKFFDRSIFREMQTGVKDPDCNNKFHSHSGPDEHLEERHEIGNRYIDNKNKRMLNEYNVFYNNENKNKNKSRNGLPSFVKIIFIIILLNIIFTIIFSIFQFVAVFMTFINDVTTANSNVNTNIISEVVDDNLIEDITSVEMEEMPFYNNAVLVPFNELVKTNLHNVIVDNYEEVTDYPYADNDYKYYRFHFEIENVSSDIIKKFNISGYVGDEECERIYWGEGEDSDSSQKIDVREKIDEYIVLEIPKDSKYVDLKYGENIIIRVIFK